MQTLLIEGLMRSAAYPHATTDIRLVETHISWILLTGEHAYKLKKPIDLGFLDFSTLERRRHFCREELRLNRRLVPELYLDVVEIRGSQDAPTIGGSGELLDYAVHMRQFDTSRQLDLELEAGTLVPGDMVELAQTVAGVHAGATRAAADEPWGDLHHVMQPIEANFRAMRGADASPALAARIERLDTHATREGARLAPLIRARKDAGFVRECHGDLHLSNLVRLDRGIRAFDCIEFSPELRWIDVASDAAFLIMDLQGRGRDDLAFEFVNEYLEITGDYRGIPLFDFYLGYRSLVRAKVAALRLADAGLSADDRTRAAARLELHVALAERYAAERPRGVVMMRGISGSGKSWLARRLLAPLEAIRVRSDVERKRLQGLSRGASSGSATGAGIYTEEVTVATYRHLAELARVIAQSGYIAIVDATHMTRDQRAPIRTAAAQADVPCIVVDCHAPRDVLEARVAARFARGDDVSEADTDLLDHQLERLEDVEPEECDALIPVDTSAPTDLDALAELVRGSCRSR